MPALKGQNQILDAYNNNKMAEKIFIPSSEIRHPNGYHSDQLGFTFRWNGHFLRGILPESADAAKRFFESGFIDEICGKGLFPKTWISEYENEEFAFIIEHEMMKPQMYATDWNFSMLRDAAVLVLDIAKIARTYGYNMIDCHKLNVMFKNSRPMYVDLGSFIPYKDGSSAWLPYLSFLRSYYYIIIIWHSGAGQIAKRSMTPGVEFSLKDYHFYKNIIWRWFPSCMEKYYALYGQMHAFAATGYENINEKSSKSPLLQKLGLFFKKMFNVLKPIKSQRQCSLDRMRSRIQRMHLPNKSKLKDDIELNKDVVNVINNHVKGKTATVFETSSPVLLSSLLKETDIKSIIAVHENEYLSDAIYKEVREKELAVTCTYYQISEGGLLLKGGRYPEDRLKSDIAVVGEYSMSKGQRGLMSALWIIKERLLYSSMGIELFIAPGDRQDLVKAVKKEYNTDVISICGGKKICLIIKCK